MDERTEWGSAAARFRDFVRRVISAQPPFNEEKQFDLVQFGARALHHIFTGRPAPGAVPTGPTRPDEIEAAAHSYRAQWTYDDQRLPTALKDIIEKDLAGDYTQVRGLRYDLSQVFQQMSSDGLAQTG